MTSKTTTDAMRRVLRAMLRGAVPGYSDRPTLKALARRGYAIHEGGSWRLTEAGRELAKGGG